jgi:serine/threonine protein kinase
MYVEALWDAYAAEFLHRDFRPGNIIITSDGHSPLIDWDLSKPLSDVVETPRCAMRTVCAIILIPCIML